MSFDIDIGYRSDPGPRDRNEDFCAAVPPAPHEEALGFIAAIADGVSAGGEGRMAAQTSVMTLVQDYFGAPPTWDTTVVLDRIIAAQNAWLAAHNRRHVGAAMSTLTALALRGHTWTVAHVGDTRAYLVRGDDCQQLTQDHVIDHPDLRSQLTRAMGQDDAVRVDYLQGELQLGDTFVLLSDGAHGRLPPARLRALVATGTAAEGSEAIVAAALAGGASDNVTALVLRVRGLARSRLEDALVQSRLLPVPPRLKVGDTLDGLTVTSLIADTDVHLLYQVRSKADGGLRALKTLHPSRASDPQERAMLAHEAWLGARVGERAGTGAGFVRLHDVVDATAFYLLFDWHTGQTLDQLAAKRGPGGFGVAEVVSWAQSAARSIGRLHRLGVIHRDIKPANLHLGDDGELRLLDLGVAVSGNEPAEHRSLHGGTPSYMNPELWDDEPVDPQTDLFALGVSLYQLLTGNLPFGDIEPYQKLRYRRDPKPPSRLRPDVPIWLDHVVLKAISLDKRQRFETAEEFGLALERGASRPLLAQGGTPIAVRDPVVLWQVAFAVSVLFNLMLMYWLLFLPKN
ncbi:bifunctional protein-serine/threonine kinase/phosphatase [Rhizobacter sp. Root1221]|uniref:bifunctional protein-serine/threonine kinase/phosphatase n=1 Tax=Rhizobacter sp. Root1221 TaxID=1736433 RepID=UPI0006FD21ED|nr:bifunctional protein-serine/threonine kinase/phosphatase [Rhizobacter sp. Root1221]KQV98337.1 serine/threonine protein phosphatase [Rhizobacter sp. Root1221]